MWFSWKLIYLIFVLPISANERVLMTLDQYPEWVIPTGLAADECGFLYCGLYNGSGVIIIDPTIPAVIDQIDLSTPFINSPTFGGPDNDILYVTFKRDVYRSIS